MTLSANMSFFLVSGIIIMAVLYFIVKGAVKDGIISAYNELYDEANTHK